MKYKFIIVDDEIFSLKNLSNSLRWEEIGFELVAVFDQSTDVIPFLENNAVDVILSDIAMPNLSGLDLLKSIKEKYPYTLVVLFSAYREFEYAQKAVSYGAFDYLTKPLSHTVLTDVFRRLKKSCDETKRGTWDFMHLTKQHLLCDYLLGRTSLDVLNEYFINYHIHFNVNNPVCLINIRINNFNDYLQTLFPQGKEQFYHTLISRMEFPEALLIPLNYSNEIIEVILFSEKNSIDEFKNGVEDFIKGFLQDCVCSLSIDISINKIIFQQTLSDLSHLLYKIVNQSFSTNSGSGVFYDTVSCATDFIEKNYSKDITLEMVADYLHMHPTYVSKLFKQEMGVKYIDYLTKVRLDKAKELLLTDGYSIDDICQLVGYRSKKYFYKIFKTSCAMSPLEYRSHILGDKKNHKDDIL